MKNGEAVITDDAERFKLHDGGALMVVNVTSSDAGDYYVMLSNEEGQQEGIIKLIVNYSPKIQQIPREVFVDRGATAVLVCSADAYPVRDDMVHWEVEEFELPPNQVYHQGTSTLTLPKVDRSLSGTYICNADNGIAPPAKAIVHLFVRCVSASLSIDTQNYHASPLSRSSHRYTSLTTSTRLLHQGMVRVVYLCFARLRVSQ
uniref:Ig-like domain-containing protein n=1 Tax=Eptatretus burgeri TaxID=7764 RepID=A0A8C4QKJ3_EPTBU